MIVLVATAWGSAFGGINAFNHGLARGLAAISPGRVACAVVSSGGADRPRMEGGVLVVPVSGVDGRPEPDCGDEVVRALVDAGCGAVVEHWVGHDAITGEAAVRAAGRHGGGSALIHHMQYLLYQNASGGRGDDTVANHTIQMELLARADVAFGVGERLAEGAAALGARRHHVLVPGFPDDVPVAERDVARLRAFTAGRFDRASERLKRVGPAVAALGRAVAQGAALVPTLRSPSLTVMGAPSERHAELEALATAEAGRPVNVVPASFVADPRAVARHLGVSNLAIVPSAHEGYGLVGWEAVGTATPLVIGRDTGLADQIVRTLDVEGDGLVRILDFDGTGADVDRMADAIIETAADLPRSLRRAAHLRDRLRAELGCTWEETAKSLLEALGAPAAGVRGVARPASRAWHPACAPRNGFKDCVELDMSVGQGAQPHSYELIAELRFGESEEVVDGIEARFALVRARLRVTPENGRLSGPRLGDEGRSVPGLEARAGGLWTLTAPAGARLPNKALGNEALCRVEAVEGVELVVDAEVTAAKRDLRCELAVPGRRLARTTEKLIGVFLKEALTCDRSGHVVLSSARLEGRGRAG